jgi:selenocysteine-specific elongation factor
LAGFGTVVTGTLSDGALALGDEVEILPAGLKTRVRGLQTHRDKLERATPGRRLAVNVTGLEVNQVQRGMVLTQPGTFSPTTFLNARFQHLADAELPLKHNAEIKFFVGAAEVLGTVRLLDRDVLPPGESGWIQLALAEPVVVAKGDRFILRRPSPGATIGGGTVVEVHAARQRRLDAVNIARLETLARGTPGEILLQALEALGPTSLKEAVQKAGFDAATREAALAEVRAAGELMLLDGDALVITLANWRRFEHEVVATLQAYHTAHPLRSGMPREELKSRLKLPPKVFNALIAYAATQEQVRAMGGLVALPAHHITFSAAQQTQVDALWADFQRDPHNTPSAKECAARVGEEVLAALIEQNILVSVSAEVLFLPDTYAALVDAITAYLRAQGKITVAEVRDRFQTSRKYALALMEHLDARGLTKRVGDERILR